MARDLIEFVCTACGRPQRRYAEFRECNLAARDGRGAFKVCRGRLERVPQPPPPPDPVDDPWQLWEEIGCGD